MKTTNLIRNRKSIREYSTKSVKDSLIYEILSEGIKSVTESDIEYGIYKDGENAFLNLDGKVGYFGKMIKAPHYIYILASKTDDYMENTGYVGEQLALRAADLGLGACWLDISDKVDNNEIKSILHIGSDKVLTGLLAVGYPKKQTTLLTIFKGKKNSLSGITEVGYPNIEIKSIEQNTSGRLGIGDFVYLKEFGNNMDLKSLESRGLAEIFFYVRMSPSWGNRQPWKFVVKKSGIDLYMRKDEIPEKTTKLEAGAVMLYFKIASHELGIPGKWNLDDDISHEDYYYIGTYRY